MITNIFIFHGVIIDNTYIIYGCNAEYIYDNIDV